MSTPIVRPMPPPRGSMAAATCTVWFSRRVGPKTVFLGPVDAHIYPASYDIRRDPTAAEYKWALHWDSDAQFDAADVPAGHQQIEMGDMLHSDQFGTTAFELSDPNVNVGAFVVYTAYFMVAAGANQAGSTPRGA